jgi:hypothetical protein
VEAGNVSTRSFRKGALVLSAIAAIGSPAWAQTPQPPDDPARPQVQTVEMALGRAIETAGRNFAARAVEIAPEMMPVAAFGEMPNVTGVVVRDLGLYVFHVQVPGIDLRLQVLNMMANRQPFPARPAGPQQQPVSGGDRVSATGVVEPDPMAPAAAGVQPTQLDFLAEYRNQVREALIDAIVDNAGLLPMVSSETLLVIAGGAESPIPNPLYRMPTRRLVLRARAADLAAFREQKISRDEVERRVLASSF